MSEIKNEIDHVGTDDVVCPWCGSRYGKLSVEEFVKYVTMGVLVYLEPRTVSW